MSKQKHKYYVVWVGKKPGIYRTWDEAREQVLSFSGAFYKGFDSFEEASRAFELGYENYKNKKANVGEHEDSGPIIPSICVDAACSGNPGSMEYRGVMTDSGKIIFHRGPFPLATNSIGEFLAIVHAFAWMEKKRLSLPVYSDSNIAIKWVLNKEVKTTLQKNRETEQIFCLIEKALNWLNNHQGQLNLLKWNTKKWGEIPADFGRK
ncbi:MAG: ribonuclease H family protein [Bacteroidales bacterium]|nr:ribonuclease H family protein [Bacteroidales bacterium]